MGRFMTVNATPKPDFLIKSLAEQGYSLKAAIADLIDNSIAAKSSAIEVLVDTDSEPFCLFIADNGSGMSRSELEANMQFPSSNPEISRYESDLGRFGLGLKTASFSQTRKFTVISRTGTDEEFYGLTWDVEYLKESGKWEIIVNSKKDVEGLKCKYEELSKAFNKRIKDFIPRTIVIWSGLYKFEDYLSTSNRKSALQREIVEQASEHLSIVFHRFLERVNEPLMIRINNTLIEPFNPFPEDNKSLRKLEFKKKSFGGDSIKMEGFILPASSIKAARTTRTKWTTENKSLSDMEGIYIYRSDRLITYGGWNGLIRKAPRLQLARLRVDIGNQADHLLHLNVAKSKVIIPHELSQAFKKYISELTEEAEKEFFNRGISRFVSNDSKSEETILKKVSSNKGPLLEINRKFPILSDLLSSLDASQQSQLSLIIRMVNTQINKIRATHHDVDFSEIKEADGKGLLEIFDSLRQQGFTNDFIRRNLIQELGINLESIPPEISKVLEINNG